MTELIKINHVEPLANHWLRIEFSDGSVKDVDLGELIAGGGVFAAVRDDRATFEQVRSTRSPERSSGPAGSTSTPKCSTDGTNRRRASGSRGASSRCRPRHNRRRPTGSAV
jgi:hypothetical protein